MRKSFHLPQVSFLCINKYFHFFSFDFSRPQKRRRKMVSLFCRHIFIIFLSSILALGAEIVFASSPGNFSAIAARFYDYYYDSPLNEKKSPLLLMMDRIPSIHRSFWIFFEKNTYQRHFLFLEKCC